jgi:hypothetical protein
MIGYIILFIVINIVLLIIFTQFPSTILSVITGVFALFTYFIVTVERTV